MSNLYSELLVKRERTIKDSITKYGLIVLTAIAVIAGLIITPLIWIAAVALGIACYFVIPKTDVEYEYLFINGDFDIRPGAASVRRAAYAHINVGRKVSGMVVPDIVHGQQGSLPGTGQTGNTVEF